MKSRLANNKNQLVELQYASERINLLLEAKQYAIDLIYYNGLKKELEIRLRHAQTIADAYKQRLDRGDASILEYNKVQLNLSTVQGEMSRVEVERNTLLSELKRLNGGIEILLEENNYSPASLPADFEEWYLSAEQKNPLLQYVKQQIEVSRKEVKLNKAMRFPKFSAGYSLEKTLGQSTKRQHWHFHSSMGKQESCETGESRCHRSPDQRAGKQTTVLQQAAKPIHACQRTATNGRRVQKITTIA